MKITCPVVKCGWEGHPSHFYAHVKQYEEQNKDNDVIAKSHERWANYYFPKIWNSDLPIRNRYMHCAEEWVKQEKSLLKQHKGMKKSSTTGNMDIHIENGHYKIGNEEFSKEEFIKKTGIKV